MKNIRLRQRRAHQDDNFAKLWHELLSVRKLIAKILVTVSRIKIKRTKEMPAKLRAFRKYAMIFSLVLLFLVLCKLCFQILETVFDGVCKRVGHCLDVHNLGVVCD